MRGVSGPTLEQGGEHDLEGKKEWERLKKEGK
jgi:hypothetical protein